MIYTVKRHGRWVFDPERNKLLLQISGYTIQGVSNGPRPEQWFGTLPGGQKWTNPADAELAAAQATAGITEGLEIRVGTLPYDR